MKHPPDRSACETITDLAVVMIPLPDRGQTQEWRMQKKKKRQLHFGVGKCQPCRENAWCSKDAEGRAQPVYAQEGEQPGRVTQADACKQAISAKTRKHQFANRWQGLWVAWHLGLPQRVPPARCARCTQCTRARAFGRIHYPWCTCALQVTMSLRFEVLGLCSAAWHETDYSTDARSARAAPS